MKIANVGVICGIGALAAACGPGGSSIDTPTPSAEPNASSPQSSVHAEEMLTSLEPDESGVIWADGEVITVSDEAVVLLVGESVRAEFTGRVILFEPTGRNTFQQVGRLPEVGEHVCLTGWINDGTLVAGKTFESTHCGEVKPN